MMARKIFGRNTLTERREKKWRFYKTDFQMHMESAERVITKDFVIRVRKYNAIWYSSEVFDMRKPWNSKQLFLSAYPLPTCSTNSKTCHTISSSCRHQTHRCTALRINRRSLQRLFQAPWLRIYRHGRLVHLLALWRHCQEHLALRSTQVAGEYA